MFEVGRDIFKNGFNGGRGPGADAGRLRFMYSLFVAAFIVFAAKTLYLGIQGTDRRL